MDPQGEERVRASHPSSTNTPGLFQKCPSSLLRHCCETATLARRVNWAHCCHLSLKTVRLSCVEAGATTSVCYIFHETSTRREYSLSHTAFVAVVCMVGTAFWHHANLEGRSLRPKVCFTQDQSTTAVVPLTQRASEREAHVPAGKKKNVSSCCHKKRKKPSLPQRWCPRTRSLHPIVCVYS